MQKVERLTRLRSGVERRDMSGNSPLLYPEANRGPSVWFEHRHRHSKPDGSGLPRAQYAGTWWLGRLQTDADRRRVIEGLAGRDGTDEDRGELHRTVRRLAPRWFVMRATLAKSGPVLLHPRVAMSIMRGPMTRGEFQAALALEERLRKQGV